MTAGFDYPVMLNIGGKACLIVGGGPVAARKLHSLCEAGARVRVVALDFCPALEAAAAAWPGQCSLCRRSFEPALLEGAFLTVAATDDAELNDVIAAHAPFLCNNVTRPERGNFIVPAHWHEEGLHVAVTSGSAAFSRLLRDYLGEQLAAGFVELEKFLPKERQRLRELEPLFAKRQLFWRRVLTKELIAMAAKGEYRQAKEKIKDEIDRYRSQS